MQDNSAANEQKTTVEKVIQINRVNKVVSGGKRMAFRAFVISGNQDGEVGLGLGKSKEVPIAIKKAVDRAKKNKVKINLVNGTLPHVVTGKFGASVVVLKPARPGRGVIAGGSVRILLEAAGLKDVVAKAFSNSSINSAKAALVALKKCKKVEEESKIRGKDLAVFYSK